MPPRLPALLLVLLVGGLLIVPTLGLDNGLARTPQMGWNSWNFFACHVNETIIRQAAAALVSTGLKAAGYTYVVRCLARSSSMCLCMSYPTEH
jgi:alpha-galactosidase